MNRNFSRALLLVLAAGAATGIKAGLHPETGLYRFQHFSPKDYGGASPQTWASAQDARGVMYFGNTDGVLEYDGLNWRLIRIANGAWVRALAADASGRIYVGARGEIGYLKPDERGALQYVSLKSELPQGDRNFPDTWRVLTAPEGVYFSTVDWLARLNPDGHLKVWHSPGGKLGKAFLSRGAVHVKTATEGLMRLAGDRLEPVPGGIAVAKTDVVGAVDTDAASILATPKSVFSLDADGLHPLNTGADDYLAASAIYTMARFPGGNVAVGTKTGGMVLLDHEGKLTRIVGHDQGLPDAYVTSIGSDREGGVWITHFSNGITRFNPGLSQFNESEGLMAKATSITRAGGTIFVGTSAGLFRLVPQPNAAPVFKRVEGIKETETIFVLMPYGEGALAGTSHGVFEIEGDSTVKALETVGAVYDLNVSKRDPDRVNVASDDGVMILQREGKAWSKVAAAMEAGQLFRTVAEDADGRVWATSRDRIWRLDFSTDPARRQSYALASRGSGEWQNAYRFRGHIVFATQRGLMSFSEKEGKLVPDSSLGGEYADGSRDVYSVQEDPRGNAWITGKTYHAVLRPGAAKPLFTMPFLEAGIGSLWGLQPDADGTVWAFGDEGKIFRWSSSLAGDPNLDFHVLTRRIGVMGSKEVLYNGAGSVPVIDLKYRDNALRFEFAAPFFENGSSVEYQFQMEGNDRGWSPWSHESRADYPRLPEGDYRFHVRARNPHGVVTEDAVSSFGIFAPWYRTWWAYGLYAALAAVFVWGVVQLRVRQLKEDKRILENTVAERTVEIRKQRDEIHVQERKSHSLLLNILPAQVADELKSTGVVQPVGFDDVTVCFTDFVGFTLSSEKMPPAHLVDALNEYFTAFDEIISRYGLEKLKTIGDSYMFVSGLPERKASHAVDAVMAAMEMVQVVKNLAMKADGTGWNIRVGLHSGPVVAGVVGIRKFAFDIWGNTVNFAARMESSGVPGAVNMSERTCRLTRGLIECEGRGNVKIKEGRELLMFLARRVSDGFAARYKEEFGAPPLSMPSREESAERAESAMICRL